MKINSCNPDQLARFLHGELAVHDEESLTQHLDRCEACRMTMEQSAAESSQWAEVRSLLEKSASRTTGEDAAAESSLPLLVRQVLGMLNPTDDPHSLGRLDDFEIRGIVGYGAMGVVFKAEDRSLDRVVAIKVMNPSLASCGTARHRFAREAKAAAGILHPNVIPIHSVSPNHALPYLVMPYIKGKSLQKRIDQDGPLSIPEILRVAVQIAAGLVAAHRKGLIHRDIKPANIMMEEGGETVVITDFGLARAIDDATMTRSGTIAGTPEFMSPEQARGESVDFCTDLFSLGSVMYMLCSGRSPFRAQTSFGVLRKINEEQPVPIREINPDIPNWLCNIIARLHSKSPAARPTAEQTLQLLERCLAHVYQPDRIALPPELAVNVSRQSFVSVPVTLKGVILMLTCIMLFFIAYWLTPAEMFVPQDDKVVVGEIQNQKGESEFNSNSASKHTVFKRLEMSYPKQDRRGTVVIDINRGFIEVSGHDEPTVVIEILDPPQDGKQNRDGNQVNFAPRYDLKTDETKNEIRLDAYNQNYPLNLRIKVPRQSNLSLDTYYDGYLQVQNVNGGITAHSQNCDIRLLNVSGTASAFTYNGDIAVTMVGVDNDADLDFESYNGSIDISLPESIKATTAVSVGVGSYQSEFQIEPPVAGVKTKFNAIDLENSSSYQMGTINSGGVPLRIESEKGQVFLRKILP